MIVGGGLGMTDKSDSANVAINPPVGFVLAVGAAFALNWFHPLAFLPPAFPGIWIGVALMAAGLLFARWAITSLQRARTTVFPGGSTQAIVDSGAYGFSRNPIYLGAMLGMIGLALAFDTVWIFIMVVPLYLVIRFGVVGREEAYLARKFGAPYLEYKSHVRRWL